MEPIDEIYSVSVCGHVVFEGTSVEYAKSFCEAWEESKRQDAKEQDEKRLVSRVVDTPR